jgi:hypothetical protein
MKYISYTALKDRFVMNHELGKKWSLPVIATFMLEINVNNI